MNITDALKKRGRLVGQTSGIVRVLEGIPNVDLSKPTSGMDPAQIRSVQRYLRGQKPKPGAMGGGIYAKWALMLRDDKGKPVPVGKDKMGRDIWKHEGPVHSFVAHMGILVRGFLQNLDSALNVNEQLTTDIAGGGATFTTRHKGAMGSSPPFVSGAGKMKFGDSLTAVDSTHTDLQGAILASTEGTLTFNLVGETATSTVFEADGQVLNNTGGNFTVNEMAVYAELGDDGGTTFRTTLIARDLPTPTVVANGLTVLGRYTFTIAV